MNDERLLSIFKENRNQYISGEQLSNLIGCSRTAIWKKIQKLRSNGYLFEASSKLGYRLLEEPASFDKITYFAQLKTKRFGHKFTYVDETSSTQELMRSLIIQGAKEGQLVLAEQQTAGRGRLGRTWYSPKGKGLWFTVLLQPTVSFREVSQLTLLTAVALCSALKEQTGLPIGIKWPNDLLVENKKISGILLESMAEEDRLQFVLAGIGISVNLAQDDFPEELQSIATSLRIANDSQNYSRERLLATFMNEYEKLYDTYLQEGFNAIKVQWESLSVTLHQNIRVKQVNQVLEGYATGIDEHGALLLRQADGNIIRCYSGDSDR